MWCRPTDTSPNLTLARGSMCSRPGAALCVVGGTLLLLSMQHYASHHGSRQARQFHGEAHQQVEVDSSLKTLRGLALTIRGGRASIKARLAADDCEVPAGAKKVHLIRHGEGVHNVAQREWRSRPEYDGRSEPYTVDNDPSGKYTDALLTPAGEAQARALQPRTQQLSPQLLIVSPLRRATQTVCRTGLEPRTSRPQTALCILTRVSLALDRGCWLSRRTWRREGCLCWHTRAATSAAAGTHATGGLRDRPWRAPTPP